MLTEKKLHRQSKFMTRIVSSYAFKVYSKDDAVRLVATTACRLLVAICRNTKDPLTTLGMLKDVMQEQLKMEETINADRPHQLEDEDKGLQRQAGGSEG